MTKITGRKIRARDTLSIFWRHALKYKGIMLLMLFSIVAANGLSVYIPFLYKRFFDVIVSGGVEQAGLLVEIILNIFVVAFVMVIFWRLAELANNRFQPRVMSDILESGFEKMHMHSYRFFSNNFTGSLVRWLGRFEGSFENIADEFYWHIGSTAIKVVFILGFLFYSHWVLAASVLVWALIYIAIVYAYTKYKYQYNVQAAQLDSKVTGRLADTIVNSTNVKQFASLSRERSGFSHLTKKLSKIRTFTWDLDSLGDIVKALMMITLEFLVFYFAIRFWQQGLVTVGDFALLQAYLISMFGHLWDLGRNIRTVYEGFARAEEMTEVFLMEEEVADVSGARKIDVEKGKVSFRSVTFGYNKTSKVLKSFDLEISPGERVALIGPSGGGKSTIVKLLFRFFDLESGAIEIDGQDISKVMQNSLRSAIGLVPQDPILFHRSLLENIRYGKPGASKAEVVRAAKMAHAHEFISKFPKGYNTFVGERGVKLSGGERQRVAIARAILKDAPILVLDEATSSLDSESELYIQDALRNLMQGRTTIVVAHRLSTIMQMDRIVVIENGKIKEQGKHEELLKVKQGIYQKFWQIQAGGFESA